MDTHHENTPGPVPGLAAHGKKYKNSKNLLSKNVRDDPFLGKTKTLPPAFAERRQRSFDMSPRHCDKAMVISSNQN
ncbi:hypothetical protein GJA_806 [Janthinobacterium agaricidamnosum NBRC 102515 = DSM 9628]|uniref:Uncharacterized protein n=1 Tax=Janthinobacterium agaricidamnosum NBRC 102515 = DSM 9628 TaxID=1349767 RepID=W0V1J7_9BURK|nr:hypothetical protein GJA_806 [Janthinobacterium agaricidamnosum NBRC 102515 = DSM 9628]